MSGLRCSVVIPAYQEQDAIIPVLERIDDGVKLPHEVIVSVDSEDDSTIPVVAEYAKNAPWVRTVVQDYGRGPANAIRYGIDKAAAPTVVVTMADGSDDVRIIDDMVRLCERGCVVVAASRYMPGGRQIGGPRIKGLMSRAAGLTLHSLAGVGTRDATNSFKAYSTEFVREVGIESCAGFEIGLELTAKARRLRLPIAEIPTIWLDRAFGASNFQVSEWLPEYLAWYRFAYGPPMTMAQMVQRRRDRESAGDAAGTSRASAPGEGMDS